MSGGVEGFLNTQVRLAGMRGSLGWVESPELDWTMYARQIGSKGWELYRTDPYVASIINCMSRLILGSEGLRFRSHYQHDENEAVSEQEKKQRKQIENAIKEGGIEFSLDAGGQMTRVQLEKLLCNSWLCAGDGFAIRVLKNRKRYRYVTCWRVIAADRVRNPGGVASGDITDKTRQAIVKHSTDRAVGDRLFEGIELQGGEPIALWYCMPAPMGTAPKYARVEYFAEDGARQVIHRFTPKQPGQIRGFSELTHSLMHATHLRGTSEAHMVGKRFQAAHMAWMKVSDPDLFAQYLKQGAAYGPNMPAAPGTMGILGQDDDVVSPNWQYQGSDFREFVDTTVRVMTAPYGIPSQFVMAQLTDANLASSRAAMDQAQRSAECLQNEHIPQVTSIIDESLVREGMARGRVSVSSVRRAMVGQYLRPRGWTTDVTREANAAKTWLELGKSKTTIFAEKGLDFEDETRQLNRDEDFAEKERGTDEQSGTEENFSAEAPGTRIQFIRDEHGEIIGATSSGKEVRLA